MCLSFSAARHIVLKINSVVQNFWLGNKCFNLYLQLYFHSLDSQVLFLECLPCSNHSAILFLLLFCFILLSKSITNFQLIMLVKNAMFSPKILSKIMQFDGPQTLEFHRVLFFFKLWHFIRIIMINLPFLITTILWEGIFQRQKYCSMQTSKLYFLFSFP